VNTGVLILSDVAMAVGARRGAACRDGPVRVRLMAVGLCSFAFLAGQGLGVAATECVGLLRGGRRGALTASAANSFFYLFTALHGVHVLGGLWFLGRTTARPGAEPTLPAFAERGAVHGVLALPAARVAVLLALLPAVSELCRGRF